MEKECVSERLKMLWPKRQEGDCIIIIMSMNYCLIKNPNYLFAIIQMVFRNQFIQVPNRFGRGVTDRKKTKVKGDLKYVCH